MTDTMSHPYESRVLIVGRDEGWMAFHLAQLAQGFERAGASCRVLNYRSTEARSIRRLFLGSKDDEEQRRRRTEGVIAAAREQRADVVLAYTDNLDFERLHDGVAGRVVFWDWDGLAGGPGRPDFPPAVGIDLMLTVSRPVERILRDRTSVTVKYLPHGVDLDFFAPPTSSPSGSPGLTPESALTFVGRPSRRRLEYLETIADLGLTIWGRRWHQKRWRTEPVRGCIRRADVVGRELVRVYHSSAVVLNLPQFDCEGTPSILSLQAFSIPSASTCLLTEVIEELHEAFEPGSEVLSFESPGELRELAERYGTDKKASREIAVRGRRRCEAEHSHAHRAVQILGWVREL